MTLRTVTATLPAPPSANRWWRKFNNRMVLSDEARAYKTAVALRYARQQPFAGPVSVTLAWYRERKSGDLDKRIGIALDAMQGVFYQNDNQITELTARRFEDKGNPRLEVWIAELNPSFP